MSLKWRKAILLALAAVLLLLSGCAKGTAHITVNKNGSVDVAVKLALDSRTQSLLGGKMEDSLLSRLQESGIRLEKIQNGDSVEYQYLKSYASMEEIQAAKVDSQFIHSTVKTAESWFYTKYDIESKINISTYSDKLMDSLSSSGIPATLVRLLMQSFAFDFKLTLPVNLYGANNATEQAGRTLTWHLSMADSKPVRMVIYAPKVTNILVTAAGGLLLAAAAAVYFTGKRRESQKPKSL